MKTLLAFFIWLNNFSYKIISSLVVRIHGTHPKHAIMRYHDFFVAHITPSDTILDIGCGNGAVANSLSAKAHSVTGIDNNAASIRTATKKYTADNLHFINGDATTYDFDQTFDVIVLSNVLEHIDKRVSFLKKIKNLAPTLLIRVPLITRDWLAVYKRDIGMEYRLDPTHFTEYTEEAFRKEIAAAGLKIATYHIAFGELYAVIKK